MREREYVDEHCVCEREREFKPLKKVLSISPKAGKVVLKLVVTCKPFVMELSLGFIRRGSHAHALEVLH